MKRVIGATAAAGCAALLIGGCGTTHSSSAGASGPGPSSSASLPAKPASERVPAAARVVTISATPGLMTGAKVPAPVTVTNAATVRKIASLADSLPLFPAGKYSCPAELGRAIQMTFRASPGSSPLAVVTADLTGCQGVHFVAGGKPQPTLSGGPDLARAALAAAGLHWTGYGGAPALPAGVNPGGTMRPG